MWPCFMALKKFMKWMLVYWILLVSFIISQIHPHKYRVITNTLPLTSLYHPFMTFRINLSLNIHTYTCNWYKIWNSLWILKSFSCISFSMYPGSGDVSSDSIDHSPAKKRARTVCKCGAVTCRGYLNWIFRKQNLWRL